MGKLEQINEIGELVDAIEASGFLELPVTAKRAETVYGLAPIHRDPFDRLLIAQAVCEPLIFLTADKQLQSYSHLVEIVA